MSGHRLQLPSGQRKPGPLHVLAGYGHSRGAVGAEIEHHAFITRLRVTVEDAIPYATMIDGFGILGLLSLASDPGC